VAYVDLCTEYPYHDNCSFVLQIELDNENSSEPILVSAIPGQDGIYAFERSKTVPTVLITTMRYFFTYKCYRF